MITYTLVFLALFFSVNATNIDTKSSDSLKKKKPTEQAGDLFISKIYEPQWADDHTLIQIEIENSGPAISDTVFLTVSDADLTFAQAQQLQIVTEENSWIFEENDAMHSGENDDPHFEVNEPIVGLKNNEKRLITLNLGEHWVYDPNCELKVEIDRDNRIHESNESNNVSYFIAGG